MTFSGGGSRAAALAESVLREMAQTTYVADGSTHALTDDVKLISSVSGGSVTAAWFGLKGAGGLETLRQDFLKRDNMATLEVDAVNPVTWFRLALTDYTRIDALEKLLSDRLFGTARMDALNQPGKPMIILNTSDMAGGESFGLTPRRFDDICSDYDALPVATGVAASAAFPVALSPVDFKNRSGDCTGKVRAADWARIALSNRYTPTLDLPRYKDARYTNDLRQGPNPFRKIDYLHFLDGGLADNLGIASLRAALVEPYDDAHILRSINQGRVQRLVIIVVNARSDPPTTIYQHAGTPGVIGAINSVVSVPIDANTANSQLALTNLLTEISKGAAIAPDAKFSGMKVYGISIDFDQLPADTAEARALRDAVKDVPTSWTISGDQLRATERAGSFLLQNDPCYQALLRDMKVSGPAGPVAAGGPACNTEVTIPRGS